MQPETVRLTIKLIDRNGKPADGASTVDVINIDTSSGNRWYNDGAAEQIADVRPGRYFVSSFVATADGRPAPPRSSTRSATSARPELTITEGHDVVLDARDADRITVKTDRRSEAGARRSRSLAVGTTCGATPAPSRPAPR